MKTKSVTVLGLAVLLALGAAYAVQSAPDELKAKIDFEFTVGNKVLPPGEYDFKLDDATGVFRIQGSGTNAAMAEIVTYLSQEMKAKPMGGHLIFDRVGDKYHLSEIWIPGVDGFLMAATKGKHTHRSVMAEK